MDDPTQTLDYNGKVLYWAVHPRPYRVAGKTRRLPRLLPAINAEDVITDRRGNIFSMPELHGVPCFGVPSAWLRHYRYRYGYNDDTGHPYQTRCGRCPVAPACRNVVLERLRVDPRVSALAARWLWKHRRTRDFRNTPGAHLLNAIVKLGPFTNSNDYFVQQRKGALAATLRAKDAARKIRERKRILKGGQVHEDYAWAALAEVRRRVKVAAHYIRSVDAPSDMKRIPLVSVARTALVWMAHRILSWQKRSRGPADIANWLIANKRNDGTTYAVLRQVVPRHLRRIVQYETAHLPGRSAPLWSRFDPESLLLARPRPTCSPIPTV